MGVSRSGGVIEGAGLLLAPQGQTHTKKIAVVCKIKEVNVEAGESFSKVGVFVVELSNFEKVSPAGWKCLGASLNALSARVSRGRAAECPEKESPAALATADQPKTRHSKPRVQCENIVCAIEHCPVKKSEQRLLLFRLNQVNKDRRCHRRGRAPAGTSSPKLNPEKIAQGSQKPPSECFNVVFGPPFAEMFCHTLYMYLVFS